MTTDADAARTFYGGLFDWQFEVGEEDTGFYSMATLQGKYVAGVGAMPMDEPPQWTTYLATADAEATADAAVRHGASVVAPAMDVMQFGRMACFNDPTGATFSVWQAGEHHGAQVVNETGALVWNELMTREYDTAKEFYSAVFSYTYTPMEAGGFDYATIEVDGSTVGGIGGFPAEVPADVPPHWRVYFAVDDADAAVAKAESLGGSVLRPATDMPYGRHADLIDPQGAVFSVIKPASPE